VVAPAQTPPMPAASVTTPVTDVGTTEVKKNGTAKKAGKRNKNAAKEEVNDAVNGADPQANMNGLHPLENEWTLWYDKRPAVNKRTRGEKDNYESNLAQLGSFGFVEEFWRYWNHIVPPSRMELNSNYHLFKKGVKPMWEDPQNSNGGKWILTVKGNRAAIDRYWENLVLGMIGETLDPESEICGAVISRRKQGDRIALWTRTKQDETSIMTIGKRMRISLGLDPKMQLLYQCHEDSLRTGASYTNPDRFRA